MEKVVCFIGLQSHMCYKSLIPLHRFFLPLCFIITVSKLFLSASWLLASLFIFPQCFFCFLLSYVPHSSVRLSTTQAPFMQSIYFAGPSCSTISAVLWGDEDGRCCRDWHKWGVTFDTLDIIISSLYSLFDTHMVDICTRKHTFCYN